MATAPKRYEVWIIPPDGGDYQLRGRTDNKDGAEEYVELSVMQGPNLAAKVVDTLTGLTLTEFES